jgi:hypothetical protein
MPCADPVLKPVYKSLLRDQSCRPISVLIKTEAKSKVLGDKVNSDIGLRSTLA